MYEKAEAQKIKSIALELAAERRRAEPDSTTYSDDIHVTRTLPCKSHTPRRCYRLVTGLPGFETGNHHRVLLHTWLWAATTGHSLSCLLAAPTSPLPTSTFVPAATVRKQSAPLLGEEGCLTKPASAAPGTSRFTGHRGSERRLCEEPGALCHQASCKATISKVLTLL